MRKSPFDVSTSHHAHQELVGGVATEMSGRNLAFFHITEWYENVFLFGVISLFFLNNHLWSIPLAMAADLVVFFFLVLLDNSSARVKWKNMLGLSWIVTLLTAGVNLLVLMLVYLV
jgi:ech hydrogenase subunit B